MLAMVGKCFGELTVVSLAGRDKWSQRLWNCSCSCGKARIVAGYRLVHQGVKSCGCASAKAIKNRRIYDMTEGQARTVDRTTIHRNQMPLWACSFTMGVMYNAARKCNLVVDHIVPLKSSVVCGLHCEDNLQLLVEEGALIARYSS